MGNTILAHALYACRQTDLDLNNFFSKTGNAHAVPVYNRTNLTAHHLFEFPNNKLVCVLQIKCFDWDEMLRIKMSYSKWANDVPTPKNFKKFNFVYKHNHDTLNLWKDFYQNFKDPSWPECATPDDVVYLPESIQAEIQNNYQTAQTTVQPPEMFVEWLTILYYDSFVNQPCNNIESVPILTLNNYLNNNLDVLIEMCSQKFNWKWDQTRSQEFYKKMLDTNSIYLTWLTQIKSTVTSVINQDNVTDQFDLWEQALIIAKCCHLSNLDPRQLNWTNNGCLSSKTNIYLTQFSRNNYGKTI